MLIASGSMVLVTHFLVTEACHRDVVDAKCSSEDLMASDDNLQ
jgi:hypothetical protein